MRKAVLILLLISSGLLLSACSVSRQVENQAYILALGVDQTQDGGIQLTVQIPKISAGQESSGGQGGSGSPYMPLAVTGADYEYAIERLNWAVPRDMNLSQLELIVLSEETARSENCPELLERIANTEDIYTAASVVVCSGSAGDFVSALKPNLGSRLSADLHATLEHYQGLGIIPSCSLAELYYRTNSVYGDPMAGYAVFEKSEEKPQDAAKNAASSLSGSLDFLSGKHESEIETRYLGAAVFSNGRCVAVLDGDEAILTNLINNSLDSFRYVCGEESLFFRAASNAEVVVETDTEPAVICVELDLSIEEQEHPPDEAAIRKQLTADLLAVIDAARSIGADPFGFAENAAANFLTLDDWLKYDWKAHYREAEVRINLHFSSAGA